MDWVKIRVRVYYNYSKIIIVESSLKCANLDHNLPHAFSTVTLLQLCGSRVYTQIWIFCSSVDHMTGNHKLLYVQFVVIIYVFSFLSLPPPSLSL